MLRCLLEIAAPALQHSSAGGRPSCKGRSSCYVTQHDSSAGRAAGQQSWVRQQALLMDYGFHCHLAGHEPCAAWHVAMAAHVGQICQASAAATINATGVLADGARKAAQQHTSLECAKKHTGLSQFARNRHISVRNLFRQTRAWRRSRSVQSTALHVMLLQHPYLQAACCFSNIIG
jgi:hypothetical protein